MEPDYIDPDTVTFFSDDTGINTIDLNNVTLGDGNFDDDNKWLGVITMNNPRHFKKS